MIDWLKNNWKTALIGACVAVVILSLICCNGSEEPAVIEEPASVTIVRPSQPVLVDDYGNLLLGEIANR